MPARPPDSTPAIMGGRRKRTTLPIPGQLPRPLTGRRARCFPASQREARHVWGARRWMRTWQSSGPGSVQSPYQGSMDERAARSGGGGREEVRGGMAPQSGPCISLSWPSQAPEKVACQRTRNLRRGKTASSLPGRQLSGSPYRVYNLFFLFPFVQHTTLSLCSHDWC